jgi:hypothetical protein
MKKKVDYLLIGTGVAPLLAAQRLSNRGETVAILNPDRDFFLEDSELSQDLLDFQTTNHDLDQRFRNNLPQSVYQELISEFPGAIEFWKDENDSNPYPSFQVEGAPWIRMRHRMWMTREGGNRIERAENLYLQALDGGWKPQWLEGLALAKRMPGMVTKNFESRVQEPWVGFVGPRFGEVDVERYRLGLMEYVQERLGVENILNRAHLLNVDAKGVRYQLSSGLPQNIEVGRSLLFFWTPKLERTLRSLVEQNQPRSSGDFESSTDLQRWEEWEILSRDPIPASVVVHFDRTRIWSVGEGQPPVGGWNVLKVMRRADESNQLLGTQSFGELSNLFLNFMGWERFTVRKMATRSLYRWNQTQALQLNVDGVQTQIIRASDGPLHWIAKQVRQTVDGV